VRQIVIGRSGIGCFIPLSHFKLCATKKACEDTFGRRWCFWSAALARDARSVTKGLNQCCLDRVAGSDADFFCT
jgi:hypothetical protein